MGGQRALASRNGEVTLFYTVAGYPGEEARSFAQRLFQTKGKLDAQSFSITGWSAAHENIMADNHYMLVNQREGVPGFIKGFRDPAHFRDPKDGATYIVFTGSLKDPSMRSTAVSASPARVMLH
jgi:levansucrase